ncbi:MAG: ImmA/IrrE family metallo-endopeptidase [Micavibrio aeruginosavorus]|nr:ImmA/IrrE family metallo-endopeptidase [Micavibrio aeruginosavorus]
MTRDFNPDMMVLARSLKEMTQADLATATGKTQAYVSKIERRVLPPSADFIQEIIEKLEFPRSFFFQPVHLTGLPASVHPMYRKQTTKAKVLERVNAEMNIRIFHLRLMPPHLLLPLIQTFGDMAERIRTITSCPKQAAREFRRIHNLVSGPIEDLTLMAEKSGIIVFYCDFGDETDEAVDGVSMIVPALPPTIFLNKKRSADRMRFSLAHEIGHLFLHLVPSDTMEYEANDFAGELLMPEQEMKTVLTLPISLNKLAALKPTWKVSIAALLMCAKRMGIFESEAEVSFLFRQLTVMGWRKQEPASLDFPPEKPNLKKGQEKVAICALTCPKPNTHRRMLGLLRKPDSSKFLSVGASPS